MQTSKQARRKPTKTASSKQAKARKRLLDRLWMDVYRQVRHVARQLKMPEEDIAFLAISRGLIQMAQFQVVEVTLDKEVVTVLDKELGAGGRDKFIREAIKDKALGLIKDAAEKGKI